MRVKKDTLVAVICILAVVLCIGSFWLISSRKTGAERDLAKTKVFETIIDNTTDMANKNGYSLKVGTGYPKNQEYAAELEVYNGIVHIRKNDSSGEADIYLDNNYDITYANTGSGWTKTIGVYYGDELYPSFKEISDSLKSYDEATVEESSGTITLRRDKTLLNLYYNTDTYLINTLETVLDSGYRQYYVYDFTKNNKITIPESIIESAIDFDPSTDVIGFE